MRRGRAALALCLVSAAASAQDAPLRELDPVVVSASILPLTEAAVNQHVSVFTREQIEREAPASVAEFLSRRAGLVVDRSARSGAYGSLFLRGADPSHVVVLIDGIRQNDPLSSRGSAVDLNTLTLDDVERIEVVRGSASVAHAEALAGVVQLFTRGRGKAPRARAAIEGGGQGLAAASASVSDGPWRAGVALREDGEREDAGSSRTRAANLGFVEQWGATRVQAQLRITDSDAFAYPDDSGGPRFAVIRTLEERRTDSRQFSLSAEHDLGHAGTLSLQAARFERDMFQNAPRVAPGVRDPFGLPRMTSDSEYRRNEVLGDWRWRPASGWETLVGIGSRQEEGVLASSIFLPARIPANFAIRRITNSVVGEARKTWGAWSMQAGLRHEHTSGNASLRHPALGVQYQAGEQGARVGAALSSAGKLPSFYALGHPLVGNPQLRPERSRQGELYYATPDAWQWKTRVTLFRAHYRDLIDFDAGPPPRLVNRSAIRATGLELTFSRRWSASLLTYGQATLMHLREPEGAAPLRHRPRRQAHIGAELQLAPQWRAHAGLTYIGRRADSSIPTGDVWLGGLTDLSLSLTWLGQGWEAYAAIDNALDRHADESIGTAVVPRRLRAGLRWKL